MPEELAGQVAPAVASEAQTPAPATESAESQVLDTQAETEEKPAVPKSFTQEELNEIVQKEKAKAEAKAERRVMRTLEKLVPQQAAVQQFQPQQDAKPTRLPGEADDAYLDRLTDWKLDQRDKASNQQRAQQQHQSLATKTESMYAEASKTPGFDRDDFNALPLTPVISQALIESDAPAKLMVYMAANPEEVERIAALSPARQAAEIGKLEAKVATAPKVSSAPAPIKPIGSRGSGSPGDPTSMTVNQWAEYMKKNGSRWVR